MVFKSTVVSSHHSFFWKSFHYTFEMRKSTVNSPPQQPDDFLVTVKTLGRLLSYIFPTSVFTIYVLCCILFLSWGFLLWRVWWHEFLCVDASVFYSNTYVLILLFYGVLNVWLIVDLPRFILIIEHSFSTCPLRVRHVRKCAKRSMAWWIIWSTFMFWIKHVAPRGFRRLLHSFRGQSERPNFPSKQ